MALAGLLPGYDLDTVRRNLYPGMKFGPNPNPVKNAPGFTPQMPGVGVANPGPIPGWRRGLNQSNPGWQYGNWGANRIDAWQAANPGVMPRRSWNWALNKGLVGNLAGLQQQLGSGGMATVRQMMTGLGGLQQPGYARNFDPANPARYGGNPY